MISYHSFASSGRVLGISIAILVHLRKKSKFKSGTLQNEQKKQEKSFNFSLFAIFEERFSHKIRQCPWH